MVSADELQKRVETLQRQLRKAGDHLKRLATENDTLTEQVEKFNESEAQLKTAQQELEEKNAQNAQQLADSKQQLHAALEERDQALEHQLAETQTDGGDEQWKAAALELATAVGVAVDEGSPQILEQVRQHWEDSAQAHRVMMRLQVEADAKADAKAELEDRVHAQAEIEAAVVRALENSSEELAGRLRSAHAAQADDLAAARAEAAEAVGAREELGRDYDELLGRIGKMKDGLKAKMSADSEQPAIAKAKELEGALQQANAQLAATKQALWDSQEASERASSDFGRQEQAGQLAAAEARMAAEGEERAQLEARVEQLQTELNRALNTEGQWAEERELHLVTITNLQGALEDLQAARDADVDVAVEKLREEVRAGAQQVRAAVARAEQAELRLRRIELSGATAEQSQQKITEQAALDESMRRLREESNDFNLDKRVITNLVVGFLGLPYGDSKRSQEEQQEKVGLIRKAGRRAPAAVLAAVAGRDQGLVQRPVDLVPASGVQP
ncbi:hypothetical protein DL89DRAFT_266539 [Linderina pennispora]|uniref:GRIP domain-containing protein n=1 Tax=Linderina pennispora TaxID=61395 RepID=A0A1Y1WE66_9FUNG|nr:uncharacterized protein DL89DRAFT_266539 [Linderina pennispora]ORX71536.1 hypothetical protein DL89DRAFT_266539 [Linderina pennispora]